MWKLKLNWKIEDGICKFILIAWIGSKYYILAHLTFPSRWEEHLDFIYWKYWQKHKWDMEECICYFHSEGLSKLEFCSDTGLLQWTFRKLMRRFASPLVLGIVGTPSWAQKMSDKTSQVWQVRDFNLGICHIPIECSHHWRGDIFCLVVFFDLFIFLQIPFHKGFGSALEWKSVLFSVYVLQSGKKKSLFL